MTLQQMTLPMKRKAIPPLAILLALLVLPGAWAGAGAVGDCSSLSVRALVEVPEGDFSLADLLAPGACSALVEPAKKVRLGRSPLLGSPRVVEGENLRGRLEQLEAQAGIEAKGMKIPARVTIRRAEAGSDCAELVSRVEMPPAVPARSAGELRSESGGSPSACGAAARIPQGTAIRAFKTRWNPALAAWNVSVACVHPAECVPFLMRLPERSMADAGAVLSSGTEQSNVFSHASSPQTAQKQAMAVRRGEKVILDWDASGVNIRLPAIALDAGTLGQPVRARLEPSGRVLHAIVVDRGLLRASS